MEKLKMHSKDLSQDNLAKIQAAFPNCVTERQNAQGQIELAIDFDLLRQELSANIVEGPQERYRLDWPGKREAMLTANAPIAKTLRPAREESVNFDDTENLFIEGDNLDALKLLQETYLGKVKMIYIDPPYNTGNDFVYEDDFAENTEEFLQRSNQKDEQGNRLVSNPESSGRFHSDWLSMMLPRLKLARNLLSDEGVIFISINDAEQAALKSICNEVFGEKNFISTLVWNTEGHTDNQYQVKVNHEYVVVYAKDSQAIELGYVIDPNTRKESNLWKGFAENSITKNGPANPPSEVDLPVGFPCASEDGLIDKNTPSADFYTEVNELGYISRDITEKYSVSYPVRSNDISVVNNKTKNECTVYSGWANVDKLREFIGKGCTPIVDSNGDSTEFYLSGRGVVYYKKTRSQARNIVSVLRNMGTTEQMRSTLEKQGVYFSYPKPLELAQHLLKVVVVRKDGIILDFFAGSATSAHAVIQLNAEDGGNRKFIMVQLPEKVDVKHAAYKAGYKTIAEISKERIRRAGAQILEGECHENWNKDIGFRVLKVDTSNMQDVYYQPQQLDQKDLFASVDNIKADRSSEDLLFQVLLDWGVDLTLPIRRESIQGKEVFIVDDNALIACFEQGISEELIHELAALNPLRAVFRDNGFASDAVKVNVTQIFKQRSPITEVKAI